MPRRVWRRGRTVPRTLAVLACILAAWAAGCGTGGVKDVAPGPDTEPQGDTGPEGARVLTAGTTQQGYIEYRGDADWFRLEIPAGVDTLRAELSNQVLQSPVDLSLTVYGADGRTILGGRYDPFGGDGLTQLTVELTVEDVRVCYLVVRDHLGEDSDPRNPYFLRATVSDGPGDANNSPDSATPLPCGAPVEDAIQSNGDVDWFRVELPQGADILSVSVTMPAGAPDLVLTLYESTGTTSIFTLNDPEGADGPTSLGRNERLLEPGPYYVSVRDTLDDDADADLAYTLTAACVQDPDPNEPNGNFPSVAEDMAHATPLAQGAPVTGWIAFQGDHDGFRFDMPGIGLLNLAVTPDDPESPVELLCTVLAADGRTVEAEFEVEIAAPGETLETRVALPAGAHYLRLRDRGDDAADLAAGYALAATYEADPDPNEPNGNFPSRQENLNHATPLPVGGAVTGYIGSTSDQDWVQVFLGTAGVYHFALSTAEASAADLSLSLYRPDGETLILTRYEDDRQGEDGPTLVEGQLYLFDVGTYYFLVQDLDNNETDLDTPYTLEVNGVPLPPGSHEPGEDRADAVTIVSGETATGYIEFEGDRDWYGIEITGNRDVVVELWSDAPSPVEFIWFMYEPQSTRVFASDGDADEQVESAIHIVTGDDEAFWVDEEHPGVYLFKLSDYNRNDWDTRIPYHIRVRLSEHVDDP